MKKKALGLMLVFFFLGSFNVVHAGGGASRAWEDVKRETTRFARDVERETTRFARDVNRELGGIPELVAAGVVAAAAATAIGEGGYQVERMIYGDE
ncbi:MAG: hypothetical protein LBF23_02765 [Endomicrobium sp.]|jgi:hypothetical protein|nr:hypothetical protein [Endomicrobium sp.]